MSGTFERLNYDADAYAYELRQEAKIVNYNLSVPNTCKPCRFVEPGFFGQGASMADRNLTDVESDLFNIGRVYSKCPDNDYHPFCPEIQGKSDGYPCGGGVAKGPSYCQPALRDVPSCEFGQIDTRTIAPPCTLRGISVPRFDPLCLDPQDLGHIVFPGEINIDNRTVIKDVFRARGPCLLRPMDQTAALPKGDCTFNAAAASASRWSRKPQ